MGAPARKLPTFEELYAEIAALPQGTTGEILGPGWLRTMSRPGARHRRANRKATSALRSLDLLEGGLGWWFEVEAEIRFGERLFVPDVSGWRAEEEPEFIAENPILVPPDWVCEILSRSTQRGDRVIKLPVYAAAGVRHAWVIDPEARTVEVYATVGGRPVLAATALGDTRQLLPPFELEIDVSSFWTRARPEPAAP
jgi:Uma2 family endonuclease